MRTESLGGSWFIVMNRRMFAYEAVSTSMENVAKGSCATRMNGLSEMKS